MKSITFIILTLLLLTGNLFGQNFSSPEKDTQFYFDAIVFKSSQKDSDARIDVYLMVPWESLEFVKSGDYYGAKYNVKVEVIDSLGNTVKDKFIERKARTREYFAAQGGTGEFDIEQLFFHAAKGSYTVETVLIDKFSNKELRRSRSVSALDFSDYPFSLSGIMLVSSIEANNGGYVITPHVSDNVSRLEYDFFVFFEIYNDTTYQDVDFIYQILDTGGDKLFESDRIRKNVSDSISRHYLKIETQKNLPSGEYLIRLIALPPSDDKEFSESDYLAIAQRSIKVRRTIAGKVLTDIDNAIRQLRYAASSSEIKKMQDAETEEDKIRLFESFWEKRDPTPNTERNEAFNQYYSRMEFANQKFKSYTKGWLTDMGHVYIVHGSPYNVERFRRYGDNRIYERWIYQNNREFIFVDNSGFGDFRLYRPMTVTEKYEYEGN